MVWSTSQSGTMESSNPGRRHGARSQADPQDPSAPAAVSTIAETPRPRPSLGIRAPPRPRPCCLACPRPRPRPLPRPAFFSSLPLLFLIPGLHRLTAKDANVRGGVGIAASRLRRLPRSQKLRQWPSGFRSRPAASRAHAIDPLSTIFLSLFLPLPSSPRSCHRVPSPSLLKASPSALTSSLASGSPSGHVHAPSPSLVLPRSIFPRRLLVRRRKAPAMVVPPPEGARLRSSPPPLP